MHHLGDLLTLLPLDVVRINVWQTLPTSSRCSLRQTCRSLVDLSYHLVTSATHNLGADDQREPWQQADQQAAFLARLPQLSSLALTGWQDEAALTHALHGTHLGCRITALSVQPGGTPVSGAASSAIAAACPNLQHLQLCLGSSGYAVQLEGGLLAPLHRLPLSKLDMQHTSMFHMPPFFPDSLVGLSHLRHLELNVRHVTVAQVQQLSSAFNNLQHLGLTFKYGLHTLVDVAALFSLTQLTCLRLPTVARLHPDGVSTAQLADVMTQLGSLSRLHSLQLGSRFTVSDAVMFALARLSQLSQLSVGDVCLTQPVACQLPHLQQLTVDSLDMVPVRMLRLLLPLLPLPSLTGLLPALPLAPCSDLSPQPGWGWGGQPAAARSTLAVNVVADGGAAAAAAAQVAALQQVCTHLAAAPRLHLQRVLLDFYNLSTAGRPLTLRAVVRDGLAPLATRLTHIILAYLREQEEGEGAGLGGEDWGVLAAGLPRVSDVVLHECRLPAAAVCAVSELPALEQLSVVRCHIVHHSPSLQHSFWRRMAAECPRRVLLRVLPHNPAAPHQLGGGAGR